MKNHRKKIILLIFLIISTSVIAAMFNLVELHNKKILTRKYIYLNNCNLEIHEKSKRLFWLLCEYYHENQSAEYLEKHVGVSSNINKSKILLWDDDPPNSIDDESLTCTSSSGFMVILRNGKTVVQPLKLDALSADDIKTIMNDKFP